MALFSLMRNGGAFRVCSGRRFLCAASVCLTVVAGILTGCGAKTNGDPTQAAPLTVTTSSLPNGQMGTAYSATLQATGGNSPYTWALRSGTLPAGLSLNAASGVISGTPTATASAIALTLAVTDAGSPAQNATANLTLTISSGSSNPPPVLTITTSSLQSGQVGAAYSATLAATGGTAPYTWALTSGTLPAGLSLNATTGAISGTPMASVSGTPLTFSVSDAGSPAQTATVNLTLTVAAANVSPISITTTSLPGGTVGTPYSATLAATGGTAPYAWTVTGGTLPAGLTLSTAGAISGTPTATASSVLTFTVSDGGSPAQTASVNLTLTVVAVGSSLTIVSTSLPNGQQGVAYSATLAAAGGTTPYTWALTSGTLPVGLSLNVASGAISGTSKATANATSLTFTATDSSAPAQTASVTLTLTITGKALSISTTSLPGGTVGTAYGSALAASGGTTPYTWSVTGGALPAGLTLNPSTGGITGTPTAAASGGITFTVTDSSVPVQTKLVTLTLTIAASALTITTVSLPSGQVGTAYNAALAVGGGTPPYTWAVTSGALPGGLTLNASTGAISGTPTTTASGSITFTVTDSSVPALNKSASLTLTVTASGITLSVSPKRAGLVTGQTLSVTPTTNDGSGVNWTATGGTFSATKSLTGVAVTYTAPGAAGVYTITATSVSDNTKTATISVAVTDLAGVATYHNNSARTGANTQEYALNASSVKTSTFGKLFSCAVDSQVYAQPLWVPGVTISGVKHNVVFVATMNDSVYAFDADSAGGGTCSPLWHANLLDSAHGANSGEVSVLSYGSGAYVGDGGGDIAPEVGVLGTPVIDLTTNTLYAVSKSMLTAGPSFYQRLHAIDLATGSEKFSGPATIAGTYPGTAEAGTTTHFNAQLENQRPGLALVNGIVYISWASHEDYGSYYGWVAGYNAATLAPVSTFNVTPNAFGGGIWMSGGAPAADSAGNLYLITGNGNFDAANSSGNTNDYGDSFLKLSGGLGVLSYFTPSDQLTDQNMDKDFGAGGATVLVDLPPNGTNPTHLAMGGGKDHALYILNRDSLGGYGDSNAWQQLNLPSGLFATGAYWNSTFYIATVGQQLEALQLNASTAKFTQAPNLSPEGFAFPGATPSVTSMPDNSNGIVWALNTNSYCTPQAHSCGPAVLYAYDATNLANELWNSSQTGKDAAGYAVKFTVPTIANGKVYVGTRGNNTGGVDNSTSTPGELDVYGLLPN